MLLVFLVYSIKIYSLNIVDFLGTITKDFYDLLVRFWVSNSLVVFTDLKLRTLTVRVFSRYLYSRMPLPSSETLTLSPSISYIR